MHAKCMVQTACCLGKSKENLEKLKEKGRKVIPNTRKSRGPDIMWCEEK